MKEKTNIKKDDNSASDRVIRGGHGGSFPHPLRSAWRYPYTPSARFGNFGFRLALQTKDKKK